MKLNIETFNLKYINNIFNKCIVWKIKYWQKMFCLNTFLENVIHKYDLMSYIQLILHYKTKHEIYILQAVICI